MGRRDWTPSAPESDARFPTGTERLAGSGQSRGSRTKGRFSTQSGGHADVAVGVKVVVGVEDGVALGVGVEVLVTVDVGV